MVAYSFAPRFEAPIQAGLKTHTIRAWRQRHARPGELLQLYCGMRTAHCRKILPDQFCTAVMQVEILFAYTRVPLIDRITVDGVRVRHLDDFARRDGFADRADMSAFWRDQHPGATCAGFNGFLIEWAPPRQVAA